MLSCSCSHHALVWSRRKSGGQRRRQRAAQTAHDHSAAKAWERSPVRAHRRKTPYRRAEWQRGDGETDNQRDRERGAPRPTVRPRLRPQRQRAAQAPRRLSRQREIETETQHARAHTERAREKTAHHQLLLSSISTKRSRARRVSVGSQRAVCIAAPLAGSHSRSRERSATGRLPPPRCSRSSASCGHACT